MVSTLNGQMTCLPPHTQTQFAADVRMIILLAQNNQLSSRDTSRYKAVHRNDNNVQVCDTYREVIIVKTNVRAAGSRLRMFVNESVNGSFDVGI